MGLTHVPGTYLGEAVYVELPPLDAEVAIGEPGGLRGRPAAPAELASLLTCEEYERLAG